jgi:hypothetical protein
MKPAFIANPAKRMRSAVSAKAGSPATAAKLANSPDPLRVMKRRNPVRIRAKATCIATK